MFHRHEILVGPNQACVAAADAPVSLYHPPNFTHCASWAKRVRFTIVVHGVTGSPTSWDLGFKLQSCYWDNGGMWRYQGREWYDLAIGGQVPDLSALADETTDLTPPLIRVVSLDLTTVPDMGADVRLLRTSAFVDGTSPSNSLTITRELWSQ